MTRLLAILLLAASVSVRAADIPLYSIATTADFIPGLEAEDWSGIHYFVQDKFDYEVSYFDWVELGLLWNSSVDAGESDLLVFPLKNTLPAGTYDIYVAVMNAPGPRKVGVTNVGDQFISPVEYSESVGWKGIGQLTSGTSIDEATIIVEKTAAMGVGQTYWYGGVAIMTNGYAPLFDDADTPKIREFVYYPTLPLATNSYTIATGNMLHNSSFELGFTTGEIPSIDHDANGLGKEIWVRQMIFEGDAQEGSYSIPIRANSGAFLDVVRFQFDLRSIVLPAPPDSYQDYTLSWYMKAPDGGSPPLIVNAVMAYDGREGYWTNSTQSATNTATTSWVRYSKTFSFAALPNPILAISFQVSSASTILIDAIQFESGSSETTYAPASPIEHHVVTERNGCLFDVGESRDLKVQFYNTGSTEDVTFNWIVYDWLNAVVEESSTNWSVGTGLTTNLLTIGATNMGLSRMYSWNNFDSFNRDEAVFSVVPLPETPTLSTNDMLGTHAMQVRSLMESNFLWGIGLQRGLSPGSVVEWNVIEPTEDNFDWTYTDAMMAEATNVALIHVQLSDPGDTPAWALTNSFPRVDRWSNYVWQVVNRYGSGIYAIEAYNEPADNFNQSAEAYADLEAMAVDVTKALQPNVIYIAFGGLGEGVGASWGEDVWDRLGSNNSSSQAKIDYVSVHPYPQDLDKTHLSGLAALGAYCSRPIWATETGVNQSGPYLGQRFGGRWGTVAYDGWTEWERYRTLWFEPSQLTRNVMGWLREAGPYTRYEYYDGRVSGYDLHAVTTHLSWFGRGGEQPLNSTGIAYLWAKQFVEGAENQGGAKVTHNNSDVHSVLFSRTGGTNTLAIWSFSGTNYTLTLTNSEFAAYDLNGNFIQTNASTLFIQRRPTYVASGTLASNQLHQTFAEASISPGGDTFAPTVAIDLSAHGVPDTRSLLRFAWTAADEYVSNYDYPTAAETRYRFSGITEWSEWGNDREVTLDALPEYQTYLEVQARDKEGNESAVFSGPLFSEGSPPEPGEPTTSSSRGRSAARRSGGRF